MKIFKPVKNEAKPIKIIETIVKDISFGTFLYLQKSNIICPIEHINPPIKNAFMQFLTIGEFGVF
ncbi:hypothetical protein D3C87_1947540 [compost metagenome]